MADPSHESGTPLPCFGHIARVYVGQMSGMSLTSPSEIGRELGSPVAELPVRLRRVIGHYFIGLLS
jgi:hypothetical protein